jgi:DNA-binding ferritin-like protein
MNKLRKVANKYALRIFAQDQAGSAMAKYTAMLRGLAIIHQQAHWTSKANNYYGDHLLLDRIYNAASEQVDGAAERTIGLYGAKAITLKDHMDVTMSFVNDVMNDSSDEGAEGLIERSLVAEESFLDFSKKLYDSLKDSNTMTLGLDDLIMANASAHEESVYLLKQRLKKD